MSAFSALPLLSAFSSSSSFFSHFKEEAFFFNPLVLVFLCPCLFVFFSLNVCMANIKTMNNFVVSGNMKGSLRFVATNTNPKLLVTHLFLSLPACDMRTHPNQFHSLVLSSQRSPTIHSYPSGFLSGRPMTLSPLNPSYLVDKYFALRPSERVTDGIKVTK